MALEVDGCGYRFLVLFFNCMLTFGSYFCFDMPSVLQSQFEGVENCTNITGEMNCTCVGCLGMTSTQYNLLYAIYAWTNALVVIGAGLLVDKVGNRVGVFLFSFLCLVGSVLFASGTYFRGTSSMLPVMLLGRLLFGSGNGSLSVVQNRITAFWFKGKELAMAFGITLTFSRLGSVLNFLLTENLSRRTILCGVGFLSAIIVSYLDVNGIYRLGMSESIKTESKKIRLKDLFRFSLSFWLLALTIMFFYNGVFPFVADASKFIQDKYKMDKRTSAYLAGAVYDVSMLISPFLGAIIDRVGKRGILAMLCALLTIPVFGLLAFTQVYPLVSTLWLGFTYSVAAASLWPSIPLVVSQASVGTAMGVTTSVQMIGIGISNIVVGRILDRDNKETTDTRSQLLRKWQYVMIFMLANVLACVATAVSLNVNDARKRGVLNESRKKRNQRLARTLEAVVEETKGNDSNETYNHDSYKTECEGGVLNESRKKRNQRLAQTLDAVVEETKGDDSNETTNSDPDETEPLIGDSERRRSYIN